MSLQYINLIPCQTGGGGECINNIEPLLEPRKTLADISSAKSILGLVPEVSLEDWIESS